MDSTWVRAAVLALLLLVSLVLVVAVDVPDVASVRGWVDGAGPWGWAGIVLGVALVLLAPVPRSAVSVLLGLVAGFPAGLAVALAGGLLGGLAAFGLGRALGRPAVARLAGRRMASVDRLMVDRGFWALLAGRLIPIIPFVALSYGAGLTAVRLPPYALSTALGLIPSTAVQVGVGASAGVLVAHATTFTVVPAVVAVLVLGAVGTLARRRRRLGRKPA
ncbi:putative membrane protein YdjX (TVP38/TMEM64 family) [Blastococcus colisei]|uniref:TVP38/TMEM64 family membrane protein n=1 Tax=Blastococcus colisei TaxID=1564162 RepID=A0A543PHU4_9ACTN|nr:VTT domain-containing protein [Blastococcus colisei]TQN43661.1 putative membrane protein YdjX (TVP38/TMEM64 family) [Blastococcus colisei]